MKKKEEKNAISKKQSNILILIIILFAFLIGTGVFLSKNLKDTYSAGPYTITFRGANDYDLASHGYNAPANGVCMTDAQGYLDVSCATAIANICREISEGKSMITSCPAAADQVFAMNTTDLFTHRFTSDKTYYCRSCTSCDQNTGCGVSAPATQCYVCTKTVDVPGGGLKDVYVNDISAERAMAATGANTCQVEPNQMYCNLECWGCQIGAGIEYVSSVGDPVSSIPNASSCTKQSSNDKCLDKPSNCYECRDSGTIEYKWGTDHCDACGPNSTNYTIVSSDKCATKSCYMCTANNNIMKWDTAGTGDSNCPGGYTQTNKSQSECVTKSCYMCTANNNIMKWGTAGTGDSNCPGGYTKTNKPQSDCVTINPTDKCYSCKINGVEDPEYTYAQNASAAASNTGATACSEINESYCKTDRCYLCDVSGGTKYTMAKNRKNAATQTGGSNCRVRNKSECSVEVTENPKTGTTAIIIAWIVTIIALGYTVFYVIKLNKIK